MLCLYEPESKSVLPVTHSFSWHAIFQDQKCIQHTITIIAHFLLVHIFGSSGPSCFYTWPYSCKVHRHTTRSPLLPHTTYWLSVHHLHIQGGHLHSICWISHPFLGLLQVRSNQKVRGIISTIFLGSSHSNSNCSQTQQTLCCSPKSAEAQDHNAFAYFHINWKKSHTQ